MPIEQGDHRGGVAQELALVLTTVPQLLIVDDLGMRKLAAHRR
jgi:hypothetical protein